MAINEKIKSGKNKRKILSLIELKYPFLDEKTQLMLLKINYVTLEAQGFKCVLKNTKTP